MMNRRMTRRLAALLICGCIAAGMPLTASAQPVLRASAPAVIGVQVAEAGTAMTPRRARLLLRQRLEISNRLALDIAAMKMVVREQAGLIRDALQRLRKRSDRLTGDQLSVLKELTVTIRNHRERVVAQEKVVGEIRLRMRNARIDGAYAEAAAAAAELIAEQEELLRLLGNSKAAAGRLLELAAQKVE